MSTNLLILSYLLRFEQFFCGKYVDKNGKSEIKQYSMYVRNGEKFEIGRPDVASFFSVFRDKDIQVQGMYNGIELKKTNISQAADLFEDVIRNNIQSFIPYKLKNK